MTEITFQTATPVRVLTPAARTRPFLAVKLDHIQPARADDRIEQRVVRIDEDADALHLRRDKMRECLGLAERDVARAFGKEIEADMARATLHGGVNGFRRREAADLDVDSGHGRAL